MVNGGFFKGKPFYLGEDETKEYAMAIVWGEVSRDAKVTCIKKPKADFGIEYHRKSFLNCTVWGDSEFYPIATQLKRGDTVVAFGTWKKQQFETKEGRKEYFDFTPSFLIPAAMVCNGEMPGANLPADPFVGEDEYPEYEGDAPESPLF